MSAILVFEQIKLNRWKAPPALIIVLIGMHSVIAAAGFVAPYSFAEQNRQLAFAPPTGIHFIDAGHSFHLRPFVYRAVHLEGSANEYQEDRVTAFPIRFFVMGAPYKLFGLFPARLHLFGVDASTRIFLAGSDAYGRDELTRLLFGGQISLFAGLSAALISLTLGASLGVFSGYYGNWVDAGMMRLSEVFLSVPWLYLLLCVRAVLPLHINPNGVFLLLLIVLGGIGWARPARLIRGVVLSTKHREYVLAARGFGASDWYLMRNHILPSTASVAFTQLALYIPQYVLAEITLSFFGLGVSEPAPSWGNMLASAQRDFVLQSCWWLLAPAAFLVVLFLGYHVLFSRYSTRLPVI